MSPQNLVNSKFQRSLASVRIAYMRFFVSQHQRTETAVRAKDDPGGDLGGNYDHLLRAHTQAAREELIALAQELVTAGLAASEWLATTTKMECDRR